MKAEGIVHRSPGAFAGASFSPASTQGPSQAVPLPQTPPPTRAAAASCVETIRRFARAAGFSSGVARQLARSKRATSLKNYQYKWAIYRSWGMSLGHTVSGPTIPKIADFLLYLWKDKQLSLSSVKAYRSMLSAVLNYYSFFR